MTDLAQFSVLVALLCFGIAFLAIIFMRFEVRMDRLEGKLERACNRQTVTGLSRQTGTGLSRDGLAQEFCAQRAEVAARISDIAKKN